MTLPPTTAERIARYKELQAAVAKAQNELSEFRDAWANDCAIAKGDQIDYEEFGRSLRLQVTSFSVSLAGINEDRPTLHVYGKRVRKDGTKGQIRGSFRREIK